MGSELCKQSLEDENHIRLTHDVKFGPAQLLLENVTPQETVSQ